MNVDKPTRLKSQLINVNNQYSLNGVPVPHHALKLYLHLVESFNNIFELCKSSMGDFVTNLNRTMVTLRDVYNIGCSQCDHCIHFLSPDSIYVCVHDLDEYEDGNLEYALRAGRQLYLDVKGHTGGHGIGICMCLKLTLTTDDCTERLNGFQLF